MNNIVYALGANIASKIIILLVNIISFRLLVSEDYGIVSLLLVMAATIGAVSGMGASVAVNSVVAKEGMSSLTSLFVKYNYLLSILISFIMAIVIYLIYANSIEKLPMWQVFGFVFIFSLFTSFNSISEAVLIGFQYFKKIFVNNFVNALMFLPICFVLIIKFEIVGVLVTLLVYRLFLFMANFHAVSRTNILTFKSDNASYKKQIALKFKELTLPVILSGLLVAPVIGLAFKILVDQDGGLQKLAYFNIVYQVYLVAVFVPNALNGFLVSHFSKNNKDYDFPKIFKYNLLFSLVICIVLFIAQDIFYWIIGDSNINLVSNYNIMLGSIVLFSANAVFASFWPSIGKAWFGLYMNIVWAITLLTVTFILSKCQVAEALAWAFLSSYLLLSVIQYFGYRITLNYAKN